MTDAERAVLTFIELNRYIAIGFIRDYFPQWDIVNILRRLEIGGTRVLRVETHHRGLHPFFQHKRKASLIRHT